MYCVGGLKVVGKVKIENLIKKTKGHKGLISGLKRALLRLYWTKMNRKVIKVAFQVASSRGFLIVCPWQKGWSLTQNVVYEWALTIAALDCKTYGLCQKFRFPT